MTCREAQKRLVELFDVVEPNEKVAELRAHLAACETCSREYAETQAAVALIEPPVQVQASPNFKERILNKLMEHETAPHRWRLFIPRLAVAGAAVVLLLVVGTVSNSIIGKRGKAPAPVLSLLAQSAQAMSNLQSVHLSARMRTRPAENFEYINSECEWVPLEMWKQFGNPPRWRVEKPGRVVVMDGVSSLLFIKPDKAVRGTPRAGFLDWLTLLLDTDKVMENELQLARSGVSAAGLAEETRDGVRALVLTVNRKAQGDFTNDWIRNKSVFSSDHTRVYRFDPDSKRLEGMQMVLHGSGGDVVVFEITQITYDEPLNAELFSLALPANVIWGVPPEQMPQSGPLPQSPKEAAVMLFDAFSREDWEQALIVYPDSAISTRIKEAVGGLQVISIGEPFQSGIYPGWFVPYEIRWKSGEVKKHNLAVRNDNRAHRWVFDGGL